MAIAPLAIASLAVSGVGAATSAAGTIKAGQAQASNANYQAQVAANNAKIAEVNAQRATAAGEANAQATSLQSAAQLGKIKTAFGAGNIDVNTGSATDTEASQRELGSVSSRTVLNNALLEAYGYRTQATGFTAESQLQTTEAGQDIAGADIGAAGQLFSAAGNAGLGAANALNAPGLAGSSGNTLFPANDTTDNG